MDKIENIYKTDKTAKLFTTVILIYYYNYYYYLFILSF